jgi:O-antigen ligase
MLIAGMYLLTSLKRRAALVVFFLAAAAFMVYLVDDQRVHTIFDTYGKNVSTALDHRRQIWESAVVAIGEKPFFGEGTGGEQTALNRAYEAKGYSEGIERSYNAHNQYLTFMLRNGIVELLCFIALLVYCFNKGIRLNNYSFLIFVMTFALTNITESCLNVQRGTVFFYFFVAAWIYFREQPLTGRTDQTR